MNEFLIISSIIYLSVSILIFTVNLTPYLDDYSEDFPFWNVMGWAIFWPIIFCKQMSIQFKKIMKD